MNLEKLQDSLGYVFKDLDLLKTALVHRSYINEKNPKIIVTNHNERLEFLGDAVLELLVTDYLYSNLDYNEGMLTALRASLVNAKSLSLVGEELDLPNQVLISRGEKEELGYARPNIVADAVEAVLGAIYLDSGIENCRLFVKKFIIPALNSILEDESYKDAKTKLQELTQKTYKVTPNYRVLEARGKDHEKIFKIGVWVAQERLCIAEGGSKQEAEIKAAEEAYFILKKRLG